MLDNFTFYLGTHLASWLWKHEGIPLFVSRRILGKYKTLYRANTRWALDSGGFTELSMYGKWQTTPKEYVADVQRFMSEVGSMDFAAIQDWMVEPHILAKTGLTLPEHQKRTVENFIELKTLDDSVPWLPVIQGWTLDDYFRCIDLYADYGVDLKDYTFGIGSICRRQEVKSIELLIKTLSERRHKFHLFGFKTKGLKKVRNYLGDGVSSSDSMAWSFGARMSRIKIDPLCTHQNCANCIKYALYWRSNLLSGLEDTGVCYQRSLLDLL